LLKYNFINKTTDKRRGKIKLTIFLSLFIKMITYWIYWCDFL